MAKDDYDVILYKILLYYYACLKREILFDQDVFLSAIKKAEINDEYLIDVLLMMQDEGLISGVLTKNAWGKDAILLSEYKDIKITALGIRYLKENSTMRKVGKALKETADIMAGLAGILGL